MFLRNAFDIVPVEMAQGDGEQNLVSAGNSYPRHKMCRSFFVLQVFEKCMNMRKLIICVVGRAVNTRLLIYRKYNIR